MYRMTVMSAFLVDDPNLDLNKCIKMSIVHDIGESIIGDITPQDGIDDQYKRKIETEAVEKLASLLPDQSSNEIRQLFQVHSLSKMPTKNEHDRPHCRVMVIPVVLGLNFKTTYLFMPIRVSGIRGWCHTRGQVGKRFGSFRYGPSSL